MELIVAVYDDWGIGRDGTQPVALSADRKFFRTTTRGAMVIAGRRTIEDFPGKQPLPGRVNVALSRSGAEIPGFTVCGSAEKATALSRTAERCFVIGGGSVYRQMLPFCDAAWPGTMSARSSPGRSLRWIPCATIFSISWSLTPAESTLPWAAIWTELPKCPPDLRAFRAGLPLPSVCWNAGWGKKRWATFSGTMPLG